MAHTPGDFRRQCRVCPRTPLLLEGQAVPPTQAGLPGIVALELKPAREQLKQIEDHLDTLDEQYASLKGVTKEIDDLRREVRTIKKHLGLNTEIAT